MRLSNLADYAVVTMCAAARHCGFARISATELAAETGERVDLVAYPEGEAYGDQGYIATAEARLMLSDWTPSFPGGLQLFGFVDTGRVNYAKHPWFTGSNRANRSGYGAGLAWYAPENITLKASYARRIGDTLATSAPDRKGRFWFQVSKTF